MLMAQRYPLYFDGIVAGSPAMRTGHSNLATRSVTVALNRIAPKGPDGRPVPGGALSDGDRKAIIAKLLDVCDARDGVKDGMIFDVTRLQLQTGRSPVSRSQDGRLSFEGTGGRHHKRLCGSEGFARQSGLSGLLLRHRASPRQAEAFPACSLPETVRSDRRPQPFNRTSMPKPRE